MSTATDAATRVAQLFRHTLRQGDVHPLLPAVRSFHGVTGGLVAPAAAAPPQPAAPARPPLDLAAVDRCIGAMPGLPQAVVDALELLRDEDSGVAELAACIERDQALTARTLRVANSAFFGVSGRVGSVPAAIQLLGRRAVGSMLAASAVSRQFALPPASSLDFGAFWAHAMATAMAARSLARRLHLDEDQAFTTGLLHDIGRLLLVCGFPNPMAELHQAQQHGDRPPIELEREWLGTDHAAIGARVARHWRFPAEVCNAIADHHGPAPGPARPADLADVVHLANALAHGIDPSRDPGEAVPPIDLATWSRLALPPDELIAVMSATAACVAELREAMFG